jgi:hypothetical protein
MHMRPRPAAGLQPTAAVLPVRSVAPQMPISGLLIGMTDAQGHGFVIATTYNLIRRDSGIRTAVAPVCTENLNASVVVMKSCAVERHSS